MASDLIRYDLLVQEALRNVVRKVLTETAKEGLRGDHHYFITFRTKAPGLRLSERMRARYPDEMTIILQHQFWDLSVNETAFEVGLSFGGVPERLLVPFEALSAFSDPAAEFGLKFEPRVEEDQEKHEASVSKLPSSAGPKLVPAEPAPHAGQEPVVVKPKSAKARKDEAAKTAAQTTKPAEGKTDEAGHSAAAKQASAEGKSAETSGDAKIVSIDAFRKK